MGGIGDFLNDVGHVIGAAQDFADKVNKWTAPPGLTEKPLIDFRGGGSEVTNPLNTVGAYQKDSTGAVAPNPSLEHTMEGMRWLYTNGISHPLATAALVAKQSRSNSDDFWGHPGTWFDSHTWDKSWQAAQHISPGQAISLTPEEARRAIESPLLYYKPPAAYLPPGFDKLSPDQQQKFLKDAGMPVDPEHPNAYIEKLRGNSSWFKYGTGAIDFSSVMFLDPTTVAGNIAGKAMKIPTVIKAPKGGWSEAQIDSIMDSGRVKHLMSGLWRNKDNPQLLMNTEFARRSGMGGARLASVVSKLQDEEELGLLVRTGMGDGRALEDLTQRNLQIKARLSAAWSRFDNLGLMRSRWQNNPQIMQMIDQHLDSLSQQISADTTLMNRYSDILGNEGLLDELHVSRWSLQRAEDRTIAQNQYLAGPARGAVSGLARGQARAATIRPSAGPITSANYTPRVVNSGVIHSRLWGASDFFTTPVTLIRSVKNMHPNGYMRVDVLDRDSVNELRSHLARIPGIGEKQRAKVLNDYLKTTTEHERKDILEQVGRWGAAKVAQRYGLHPDIGVQLWRKHVELQQGEIAKMRERYTAALDPERSNAAGQPLHLDEIQDVGGKVSVTPFTASRLMNGHTFQDLEELHKVIARHGNRLETLRAAAGGAKDWVDRSLDFTSYLWKFTTLFRLGYVGRVLGDDLASQWASVGTAAMALRTAKGIQNAFENGARWIAKPALQAREQNALNGADFAKSEMAVLRPQIRKLEGFLKADAKQRQRDVSVATRQHQVAQAKLATLDPADLSPKANAIRQFANQRRGALSAAHARQAAGPSPGKTAKLVGMKNQHDFLARYHDLSTRAAEDYRQGYQKVIQGAKSVNVDGVDFPAAFGGRSGAYALDQISADQSVGNIFASNRQLVKGNLERSFDHGGTPISAAQDPEAHLDAWTHAINNVIMQDALSKMAVKGASIDEMTRWLQRDPKGIAYRARLPKMIREEDFARSAKYEVDQYMHTPEIRQKALEDPNGVSPAFLKRAVPEVVDRPDVHTGQIGLSQLHHMNTLDRTIQWFYKVAATIPANRMSRHPLFNQFYEGHMTRMVQQWKKQTGKPVDKIPVAQVDRLAHNARQLALRDTRALVFDIAHRSDAAAAMRYLSPFFSATAEAFQRWGRVIADKPQIVGYAANWYNAPAYLGAMQDMDGNHIDDEGYTYIPQWQIKADGTPDYSKKPKVIKRLVPKSERYIITRLPKWLVQSPLGYALNVRESEGRLLLSQNSINMVTQGDPWFNPGVGPVVQIPVNEFVKDKPHQAELARQLGILPFGVQSGQFGGNNPFGRALQVAAPAVVKNFLTEFDTSDERYQSVKMQIMNREIYNFQQDHGGRMPTQSEINLMQKKIADRTKSYWFFSAMASFVQPFATQRKDPYQFYYDQYRALRNQNPLTADDEFLKRFDESRFIFASEVTKSQGISPTMAAVDLAKKYGKQITKHPELAALVIGPEGRGPFSPEAYRYELNNPLIPGSAEMMRTKLSADEALAENRKRLGWAKYTARMNALTADLHKAGFHSFEDEGAEDFKAQKKAWVQVYSNPLKPDGTPNPFYNKEWGEDYNTFNPKKYDEMIPALMDLAVSPLADDPRRNDLRQLKQYLGGRLQLVQALNQLQRDGQPHTLAAAENNDLRYQWVSFVDRLIEQSPSFGDLYHRYLSRDMGVDATAEEEGQQ